MREDNSAVVAAITKGYSIKLQHLARTPKLSLASLNEACSTWCSLVQTPTADQLGDYFTKCLAPNKFDPSRLGLRIKSNSPTLSFVRTLLDFVRSLVYRHQLYKAGRTKAVFLAVCSFCVAAALFPCLASSAVDQRWDAAHFESELAHVFLLGSAMPGEFTI